MPIREQGPMLAEQHKRVATDVPAAIAQLSRDGYFFDEKLDGIRGLAHIEDGAVRIMNRRGDDIAYRYPELVAHLSETFPEGYVVLDGEIVCFDADGNPDFRAAHTRDAQSNKRSIEALSKSSPAAFVAFDALWFNGADLRPTPYVARRKLLQTILATAASDMLRMVNTVPPAEGQDLWDRVRSRNGEGLIAKSPMHTYRSGRSSAWIKLKHTAQITVVLVGYKPGKGRRASMPGAFNMALIDDQHQVHGFGEVGTGFTDAELQRLGAIIDSGKFVVGDVEIQNVTRDGKPRFPAWRGERQDVTFLDAKVSQLTQVSVV